MDTDLGVADVELDLDSYSLGLALGVGAKYALTDKWDIDLSAKWISIGTDVKVGGTTLTSVSVDPWLLSAGASYRF